MPRYYTTEQGKNTEEKNERTERSDTNFFFSFLRAFRPMKNTT